MSNLFKAMLRRTYVIGALKGEYASISEVPEALREHYTEADGKAVLQAEGFVPKTKLDEFRNNNINLSKQVDDFKNRYGNVDIEAYNAYVEEQQKLKDKKLIEAGQVDQLVEERVDKMKSEYETQLGGYKTQTEQLQTQLAKLVVDNALTEAAAKAGVRTTALEDIMLRGRNVFRMKDGSAVPMDGDKVIYGKDGVTPMSMPEWLGELAARAPHLFNPSNGGGAQGNHGNNGGGASSVRSRADLKTAADKAKYIGDHGMQQYLELPVK